MTAIKPTKRQPKQFHNCISIILNKLTFVSIVYCPAVWKDSHTNIKHGRITCLCPASQTWGGVTAFSCCDIWPTDLGLLRGVCARVAGCNLLSCRPQRIYVPAPEKDQWVEMWGEAYRQMATEYSVTVCQSEPNTAACWEHAAHPIQFQINGTENDGMLKLINAEMIQAYNKYSNSKMICFDQSINMFHSFMTMERQKIAEMYSGKIKRETFRFLSCQWQACHPTTPTGVL